MPPALSEYDSESDVEDSVPTSYQYLRTQHPSPRDSPEKSISATIRQPWGLNVTVHESTFERTNSKGRKRSTLHDGIDLDNIIHISDDESEKCLPKDTQTTSSYKTRAQLHGSQRSELCYDQKYHPMDEYTQPKRAAKLKSKYGECSPVPDGERDASDFDKNSNEAPVSGEEEYSTSTKRMKSSPLASPQGTRRSSRRVNREALYDSKVHPQDAQMEMFEASQAKESGRKHQKLRSVGIDTDEENEYEMDNGQNEEHKHGTNMLNSIIPDKGGSSIQHLQSSSTEPFPLSTSGQKRSLVDNTCRKDSTMHMLGMYKKLFPLGRGSLDTGQPFSIFTEDLQTQLNAEASAGPPVFYDDDDKENNETNPDNQNVSAFQENTDDDSEENIAPDSDLLADIYYQSSDN